MRHLLAGVVAALSLAAPAAGAPRANELLVRDWRPMAVSLQGPHLTYAVATRNTMPGGYIVHQTDTYRIRVAGTRPAPLGSRTQGVLMRTSAGRTTAGPLTSDAEGRHMIVATGVGFTPQAISCCTPEGLPTAVDVSGAPNAPVTIAAAIDWPNARLLQETNGRLVSVVKELSTDVPFPTGRVTTHDLAAIPARHLAAIAPAAFAWVGADDERVHVRTSVEPTIDRVTLTPRGRVRRLLVAADTIAVVNDTADGRFELVRYDAPTWTAQPVWSGTRRPEAVALDGTTLVMSAAGRVMQHTLGGGRRTLTTLRNPVAALATDGTRLVLLERINVPVGRRRAPYTSIRLLRLHTATSTTRRRP